MRNSEEKRVEIINKFLDWCDKIGYSGQDGVKVIIIDGLPISVERPTQSLRFDVDGLTKGKQNATME